MNGDSELSGLCLNRLSLISIITHHTCMHTPTYSGELLTMKRTLVINVRCYRSQQKQVSYDTIDTAGCTIYITEH